MFGDANQPAGPAAPREIVAVTRNPTRYGLVECVEDADRRLQAGSQHRRVPAPSHRAVKDTHRRGATRSREGLTEEALALFDLLTKPDPVLSPDDAKVVKVSAKRIVTHLHDKLVLDWRRRADAPADVLVTIQRPLDEELPEDPYPPSVFEAKVQAV